MARAGCASGGNLWEAGKKNSCKSQLYGLQAKAEPLRFSASTALRKHQGVSDSTRVSDLLIREVTNATSDKTSNAAIESKTLERTNQLSRSALLDSMGFFGAPTARFVDRRNDATSHANKLNSGFSRRVSVQHEVPNYSLQVKSFTGEATKGRTGHFHFYIPHFNKTPSGWFSVVRSVSEFALLPLS